ncbi:protein of unknown function [Hathewaya proteolytica DSM 3090]|uniref:DUF4342 domain-containing protein n=1 Tax=Hathewaya proteolytica DSM 3090 TaxID=1121331 RepID=A0A1M6QJZ6_9CLOT|nr:DUF4342 domain-containing protein [Hathewaya proteolytica]SHK20485.1 protein of unknown function [Hathewaya proteolytica DSM 3090]
MEKDKNLEQYNENGYEKSYGIGELLGRICKFISRTIKKGCVNYLMVTKDGRRTIKLSLTLCAFLTVVAFVPVAVLTVVGLFTDHKFSLVGPNIKSDDINDVFGKAADSARNMKNDFKEGYRQ